MQVELVALLTSAFAAALAICATSARPSPDDREGDYALDVADDTDPWIPYAPEPASGQVGLASIGGHRALRFHYSHANGHPEVWFHRRCRLVAGDVLVLTLRVSGSAEMILSLRDNGKQQFSVQLPLATGDRWQTVRVPADAACFSHHSGGADDGVMRYPLTRLYLKARKPTSGAPSGSGDVLARPIWVEASAPRDEDTLDLQVRYSVPGGVALVGERAKCVVSVSNHIDRPRTIELHVRQTADDGRATERAWPLSLGPLAHRRRTFPLPTARAQFRALVVSVTEQGRTVCSAPGGVAVVRRIPNFGAEDDASYFGIHTSQCNYAAAERLGAKVDRWFVHNASELPFLKRLLNEGARPHHMKMVLCVNEHPSPAAWQRGEGQGRSIDEYLAEQIPKYRSLVRDALLATMDCLAGLEVCNEPDGQFWHASSFGLADAARAYAALVRVAYEEVQAIAPGLPVIAIDTTGRDFVAWDTTGWATPGSPGGLTFARAVFPHAAHALDVYALHPYSHGRRITGLQGGQTPEEYDARGKLQDAVALMKQHKGEARLWPTEWGWMMDFGATQPFDACQRRLAAITAQALVTGKTVPEVEKVMAFLLLQDYPYLDNGDYGLLRSNGDFPGLGEYAPPDRPRVLPGMYAGPSAAAYATTAYMLHDARIVHSVEAHGRTTAWRFDRPDGRSVIVLWHRQRSGMRITLRAPASAEAVNVYGRTLGKGSRLGAVYSDEPVFLSVDTAHAGDLEQAIASAAYTPADPVVVRKVTYASMTEALAVVENQTDEPVAASFDAGGEPVEVSVKPGVQRVIVPLAEPAAEGLSHKVTMTASGSSATADLAGNWVPVAYVPHAVADGKLTPTPRLHRLRLDGWAYLMPPDASWTGPADLSADAWFGWNKQALYFAATVTDNVHEATRDAVDDFWQSDSIQVALCCSGDSCYGFGPDDRLLGFVLGPHGPRAYEMHPTPQPLPTGVLAAHRDGCETVYEAAIPWSALRMSPPTPGQAMPINFIVNDNDGDARKFWMGLTTGIGEGAAPINFRSFIFQPRPE